MHDLIYNRKGIPEDDFCEGVYRAADLYGFDCLIALGDPDKFVVEVYWPKGPNAAGIAVVAIASAFPTLDLPATEYNPEDENE